MRTINRRVVGVYLISSDDQIVLGKMIEGGVYQGQWVVPGGGPESGETLRQAAVRETYQEVGIDIAHLGVEFLNLELTGSSPQILGSTGKMFIAAMTFHNCLVRLDRPASAFVLRCADDLMEASWHPRKRLPQLDLSDPTVTTLKFLGYL